MKAASKRKSLASMTIGAIFERINLNDELVKAFRRLLDHRGRRTDHRKACAFVTNHALSLIEAELSIRRRTPTFRKQWLRAIEEHANWVIVEQRVVDYCLGTIETAFGKHANWKLNFSNMPDDPRLVRDWLEIELKDGKRGLGTITHAAIWGKINACSFVINAVMLASDRAQNAA